MNRKRIIIGIIVAIFVFVIVEAMILVLPKKMNSKSETLSTKTTETITEKATEDETASSSSKKATEKGTESKTETSETEPAIQAPDNMVNLLAQNDNSLENLSEIGCQQFVTVSSNGSSAHINFYELNENMWVLDDTLSCDGFVGSNGVTTEMHEGGYASPKGLYPIGDAFYIYNKPETNLSIFEVTNDTYWVDDPDSKYYNKRVEGTADKDWNSAEHMIDYSAAYEYGFVIDYNPDAVYNAGSAIFFHISYSSTAGCVGTDKDMVLQYLAKLDSTKNPYILII